MLLSFVSFVVCFERPRSAERFVVNQAASIAYGAGARTLCNIAELSTETATLNVDTTASIEAGEDIHLYIPGVGLC